MSTKAKVAAQTGTQPEQEIIVAAPTAALAPGTPSEPIHPLTLLDDTAAAFETLFKRIDVESSIGLASFANNTMTAALEIRANPVIEREFNRICHSQKIKFKVTSDIFTRASLYIMGKRSRSRASKMASILRYWDSKNLPPEHIADWVSTEGGWEKAAAVAARRSSRKELTAKRVARAKNWAKQQADICKFTAKPIIGSTKISEFGVALVQASSGAVDNAILKYVTSDPALTQSVLLFFAAEMEKGKAAEAKKADAKARLAAQQAAVADTRETAA